MMVHIVSAVVTNIEDETFESERTCQAVLDAGYKYRALLYDKYGTCWVSGFYRTFEDVLHELNK